MNGRTFSQNPRKRGKKLPTIIRDSIVCAILHFCSVKYCVIDMRLLVCTTVCAMSRFAVHRSCGGRKLRRTSRRWRPKGLTCLSWRRSLYVAGRRNSGENKLDCCVLPERDDDWANTHHYTTQHLFLMTQHMTNTQQYVHTHTHTHTRTDTHTYTQSLSFPFTIRPLK